MFKRSNFCHVASNNRNNVKAGLFIYRTTDDLATVTASGYFNDMIIDINLHDLIIHEKVDATDNTKVQRNVLCVTEKTLENIGTVVIPSQWEEDIGETFVKVDGTSVMSGALKFSAGSMRGAIAGGFNGVTFFKMDSQGNLTQIGSLSDSQFIPASDNTLDIGTNLRKIERIFLGKVNNGYDIAVPVTNGPDTLALKSEVDLAANSGRMITDQGVWYAKMYAASTVPTGAEYDGKNYADFSQTDSGGNPVIKIYTGASGVWTLTDTITPPAEYDGYVPITSKIWDIVEQTNQQGGRVLWNHQSKEFTPYPNIVDLSDVATTDLDNLTTTGKANVSAQGTYDSGETYSAGTVGEAIQNKANVDMDNLTVAGKAIVANYGMPGSTYDDLTLGASGTEYIAPGDGYFVLNKTHGANTSVEILTMQNYAKPTTGAQWVDGLIIRNFTNLNGVTSGVFMPVKKGDKVAVLYSFSGATNAFRFYYAQGES